MSQDVTLARADREPQSDLARALGHGHEHDVHDPDAADRKRDAGDGGKQKRQRAGTGFARGGDVGEIADREIVVLSGLHAMALAQERLHVFFRNAQALAVTHLHIDRADRARIGQIAAEHALARGVEWNEHDVVLVLAPGRLAFLRHYSDDAERHIADAQFLPDRIEPAVKIACHSLADQRDLCAARDFLRLEHTAGLDIPFARLEPPEIDAEDAGRPVHAACDQLRAAAHVRRGHLHARHFLHDRGGVVVRERRGRAAAKPHAALRDVARHHDQEVGAEAADLGHYLLAGAAADGDHRDHRRDADDDAEHGQRAAQFMQAQRVERGDDGVEQGHSVAPANLGAASFCKSSSSLAASAGRCFASLRTRPSLKRTRRAA